MNNVARKSILVTILLSGTQVISLPFISLTIFQIAIIISTIICIGGLSSRKSSKGRFISFSVIWGMSSILAWLTSINSSWANSYVLLGLMTSTLLFMIPYYFTISDLGILEKTLIRSQYIVIPFAIYSFYMFYNIGGLPSCIDLPGGLFILLDDEALLRGQAASQLRLMLPYATPPVLSLVMGMCITILLFNKSLYGKNVRRVLLMSFFLILVLTGSRTGFMGLTFLFMLHVVPRIFSTKPENRKYLIGVIVVSIVLFFIMPFLNEIEYIYKIFINRSIEESSGSLMEDRHFTVPLDGFLLWIDNLYNFIFGIGFGSSTYLKGAHTELPPYFLNSFITTVSERGILGLIIVVSLIKLSRRIYKHRLKLSSAEKALGYALFVGLISSVFYEAFNCYFLIYVIAISFVIDKCFSFHESQCDNSNL